jgi:hypothetical protein
VSDKNLVLDCDSVADERVTLDLAVRTNHRTALNFDECSNASSCADAAAVQVREGIHDHSLAEVDVVDEAVRRIIRWHIRHG